MARWARSSTRRANASRWRLSRKYDATPRDHEARARHPQERHLAGDQQPAPRPRWRADATNSTDRAGRCRSRTPSPLKVGVDHRRTYPGGVLKFFLVVVLVGVAIYLIVRVIQRRGVLPDAEARAAPPVGPDDDPDFLRDLDRKKKHPEDPDTETLVHRRAVADATRCVRAQPERTAAPQRRAGPTPLRRGRGVGVLARAEEEVDPDEVEPQRRQPDAARRWRRCGPSSRRWRGRAGTRRTPPR